MIHFVNSGGAPQPAIKGVRRSAFQAIGPTPGLRLHYLAQVLSSKSLECVAGTSSASRPGVPPPASSLSHKDSSFRSTATSCTSALSTRPSSLASRMDTPSTPISMRPRRLFKLALPSSSRSSLDSMRSFACSTIVSSLTVSCDDDSIVGKGLESAISVPDVALVGTPSDPRDAAPTPRSPRSRRIL